MHLDHVVVTNKSWNVRNYVDTGWIEEHLWFPFLHTFLELFSLFGTIIIYSCVCMFESRSWTNLISGVKGPSNRDKFVSLSSSPLFFTGFIHCCMKESFHVLIEHILIRLWWMVLLFMVVIANCPLTRPKRRLQSNKFQWLECHACCSEVGNDKRVLRKQRNNSSGRLREKQTDAKVFRS